MSKNSSFRVHNDSSQAERRAILRNEREVGTYHAFATSEAGTIGGRFAAEAKQRVTGATPAPQYPALPDGAFPNQAAAVPLEPSLGVAIDQMEPTGTYAEIEQSLMREARDGAGRLLPDVAEQASPDEERRSDAGSLFTVSSDRAPSSPPQSKRKSRKKG
jgi:hypothetical protein